VSDWEPISAHVGGDVEAMTVSQVGAVSWDLGTAPDEFQVSLTLFLSECLKHLPEEFLLVFATVSVVSDSFECFSCDILGSTDTKLKVTPGQEREDVKSNDFTDAFLDPANLLLTLCKTSLDNQVDELLMVLVSNLLLSTSIAQFNHSLITQNSSEGLFHDGVEVSSWVGFCVLLGLFEQLEGELIVVLQVIHVSLRAEKSLPEDGWEVVVHSRLGTCSITQEVSQQTE
jgi:hypothetical protein